MAGLTGALIYPGRDNVSPTVAAAKASVSRFGGTSQMSSARSQSVLDGAIDRLQGITRENSSRSQSMADAANAFTAAQADKAMEFSAREAAKNRDWQKMMSDTAHQREVRDLQAAGLNPVLSAMGGNGAAVTSGATASSSAGSGQKGEVDTSLSHGLVSLLSTMLGAQTQLAQTAMSAKSNEAIADKNNAMSKLIAEITGQYSLDRETLAGEYGLKRQDLSDYNAMKRTVTSGEYSLSGKRLDNAARAALQEDAQAFQRYMAENFPSNGWQAIAAVISQLFGGGSGPLADVSGVLSDVKDDVKDSVSSFGRSILETTGPYWLYDKAKKWYHGDYDVSKWKSKKK